MRAPLVVAIALVAAGCPGKLQDPARFTAACPDVPTQILALRCAGAGCHATAPFAAGLDLASPNVAARLVGVAATGGPGLLVDPMNPDGSVLIRKLTSTPPFGGQQPPGAPLDPATIDCIRAWVRTLAPSDAGTPGD
jgi:hypothetical protein